MRSLVGDFSVTHQKLLNALSSVRGNQRVTSANPEASYEALQKYGLDLVEMARKGKLDPVIGRDQEIRSVIRILSRKTKNNPVLIGEPGVGKTAIFQSNSLIKRSPSPVMQSKASGQNLTKQNTQAKNYDSEWPYLRRRYSPGEHL